METKQILIDARPLVDPKSGGVRRVALRVLTSLIESDEPYAFTFVTTGASVKTLPEPFASNPRVKHVHIKWPNKLLSLLMMFGVTTLDRLAAHELKKCSERQEPTKRDLQPTTHLPTEARRAKEGNPQPPFDAVLLPNLGFVGFMETPYALVLHDLSFRIDPRWFPLKMRIWHVAINPRETARRASRIFAVSETTARDAARLLNVSKDKIDVFHPGIPKFGHAEITRFAGDGHGALGTGKEPCPVPCLPAEAQRAKEGAHHVPSTGRDHRPYVLAFAEQDPRKNVKTAIAAVERIRKDPGFSAGGGNLSLVIVGSPRPTPDARCPDWMIRTSSISDQELASLYENASALLYPSWYEGFGLPLHEAARFGIPCIASPHGALPETAPQGTVFAPPAKPHLWTSILRDILLAPDRYRTTFDASLEEADISPIKEWLRRPIER
jgi:glycosyltransferase involved in cell wall biosynthesis